MAAKKLDYLMMNEKERRAYDGYLAYPGQELGILDAAKADGKAEGRAEVMIEIAKEMLIRKMDMETISQITKLPLETIQRLAKELGLCSTTRALIPMLVRT